MKFVFHECDTFVEEFGKPLRRVGMFLFVPERPMNEDDVAELMLATDGEWETPMCGAPAYIGYLMNPTWN